ncbi:MAG: SdrD B-like domain-containing protein [Candidatus Eisenbacteria bacterium]
MKNPRSIHRDAGKEVGFTLVELMITLVVFAIVAVAIAVVVMRTSKSSRATSERLAAEQTARAALDYLTKDIRSAGYDVDLSYPGAPQPAIAYVDSAEIILCENLNPWPDTLTARRLAPQAYDPSGSPKPARLNATSWAPPAKYRTGAELVRYTLDVNNDGSVNASDLSAAQGADARMTPNPNDYVLVREVYGDSTNNSLGDNGGAQERVALVSKPGGSVPPMFTVYMRGSSTPWNWANGPVPAGQLQDIERVEVSITVPASKPAADGTYPSTRLSQQINALRSTPDFGVTTYTVSGYVYEDANRNHTMDTGDTGLSGVTVRLGNYIGYTAATGYWALRVPNGTYTLRHTAPTGYGCFTSPDSFVVTVAGAAVSRSFADTARAGGWVNCTVFDDADGDQTKDSDESYMAAVRLVLDPGHVEAFTDVNGVARLFAPAANYQVGVDVPDSMTATTTNPVTGTMTMGGTASHTFGLQRSTNGHITGQVFRDNNRNGVPDGTDAGLGNVWVGVTTDNGVTVQGYAYTDGTGHYDITVPANNPPHTNPYTVFLVPPAGFFPTNSTTIGNIWVSANATVSNQNFGMSSFTVITLNASRVLSLASSDLVEADWQANKTQEARMDADIVLGADAGGTDQVSAWFNQYASSPLFTAAPTYVRSAPNAVMAMALDTLDRNDIIRRPDLVTGTKKAAAGNFFVWYSQGSKNNEGYIPTTYSTGQAYTTMDGGDVQSVLTYDCSGGSYPDIIVGTKSTTLNRGSVEVWQNSNTATPTYTRQEVYPAAGGVPGGVMGEVTAMALADFDGDGVRDLVVGTKTGTYTGEVLFFKCNGRVNGNRFVWKMTVSSTDGAVTALAVTDMNGDGKPDLVYGTQNGVSGGDLKYMRNYSSTTYWYFSFDRQVAAPGIVQSLTVADMGGNASIQDLAVGYRTAEGSYGGGVRIYYLDIRTLPNTGVDPSNGSIVNMVPASTTANYNYGLFTTTPPSPYLPDLAVGVKSGASTGALVVFIR